MNYAQRHRHLSPYAENPFRTIEIGRVPIEDAKPIVIFTPQQEKQFLEACDDWQFPIFFVLLFTGLRLGELTRLLLPDDVGLSAGWLHIRNKPALGWRVKTRNERAIPLHPIVAAVIKQSLGNRETGPVFRQRRCADGYVPPLTHLTTPQLERELLRRIATQQQACDGEVNRKQQQCLSRKVWRDLGAIREDWIRLEFMQITKAIELSGITAPKTLRHCFATMLQDANVDPLIRNEVMGHSPASTFDGAHSLGMTGVYTHTQPETSRRQLCSALSDRLSIQCGAEWLSRRDPSN